MLFLLFFSILSHGEIYQWHDSGGNVVFSNSPPTEDQPHHTVFTDDLNIISPQKPSKNSSKGDNKNKMNDIELRTSSILIDKPKQEDHESLKTINITVISPEDNAHIHNFNPIIPLTTTPTLSKNDQVYVTINDNQFYAIYQNNTWNIPRPEYPGKNKITIFGKTQSNETFFSNPIILYVHNNHLKKKSR
ncbi:DUF4124 domain-containing protein [Fastidiosibacter lacustris]|uniref:DUF4124 domain-containing protein n=1 Tax=Fastidiosibacter lacustris TaxID=2056695 RepID=UPI0013002584|nr:DUF4124 domain-containing protein [Fastidiosibacter lacustris]